MSVNPQVLTQSNRYKVSWGHWLSSLACGAITTMAMGMPIRAAENIILSYGPLEFSLKVSSLEAFAKDGTVDEQLEQYMSLAKVTEPQKKLFRETLTDNPGAKPIRISRFFSTEIGEDVLTRLGQFITLPDGGNGKDNLKQGMLQAVNSPEGLTLLNFLQKLPSDIKINGQETLALSKRVKLVVAATKLFSSELAQLSAAEAKADTPVDYSKRPDLRKLGQYQVKKQTWTLTDAKRDRTFYVEVYVPQQWRSAKVPVAVLSHGLSSQPSAFEDVSKQLASYGFVVAVPQHPGSDNRQIQKLLAGESNRVFLPTEFIDRPLDISYVIDELERRNDKEFGGRLALDQVGVMGHSFGGYTALAIAGAPLDFDHLKSECTDEFGALNTSLLLQCRALELPQKSYNFRDERVTSALASNPVNSAIFGPKGSGQIKIPVFIGAGTYDPATPFIFEQVQSFPWLKTPQKYLMMIEGQAHVDISEMDAGVTQVIDSVPGLTLPSPQLLDDYIHAMVVAFAEVHIANNAEYRQYLQPGYLDYLSKGQDFKSYLITAASSDQLDQEIEDFKTKNNLQSSLRTIFSNARF